MASELLVRAPDGSTRTVRLEGERITLGRSRNNEICYPDDASLSRCHLAFEPEGDGWHVRDMGSKNGTLVDGARLAGVRRLTAGIRIEAGQLVLVFEPTEVSSEQVDFYPGSDVEGGGTMVLASLQGVLSGAGTAPLRGPTPSAREAQPGLDFNHPAVRALIRAGRELSGQRPLPELFRLILDLSIEAVEAERAVLMTLEGDKLVTRAVHGEGVRISTAVRDRVLETGTSLLVMDAQQDESWAARHSISEQQIRTLMAAPLQTEDRIIGLIYVDSRSFVRELTADDLSLLTVLANVAATRIENQRLVEVEQNERLLERDLRQAAEIQNGLLPAEAPDIPGLDVAGYNAACRTVGGDYYDFLGLTDGRLGIVLGDVSGKGMPAALMMTGLQARVQVLAEEPGDLGRLVSRLDRFVATHCPINRFVSLFFCALDPRSGELAYCNAGHNPPLLVRADGSLERLAGGGTVLGILPEVGYEEQRCQMDVGDLVAVYSDGVTEATNPEDEEFGEARLLELLRARRSESAPDILEAINCALAEWTHRAPPADDITLVIARRTH